MSKLPRRTTGNPTTPRSKVVASRYEKSQLLRQILANVLRFLREKRAWPLLEGQLPAWILAMHGLKEEKLSQGPLESTYDEDEVNAVGSVLSEVCGPTMDVRRMNDVIAQSRKLADEKGPKIAEAIRQGDRDAFQASFSEVASNILETAGIPNNFSKRMDLSFDGTAKLLRASRATLICVALYGEHPLVLIARASKEDRQAVLDLVKADKLFLHDQCCAATIKRADLQEDKRFIEQIKRALEYQPRIRRRKIQHVYYCLLFLFERWGIPLPPLEELWSTVDPLWREYKSLAAFERDFQRRRQDFTRMMNAAHREISIRGRSTRGRSTFT